MAKAENIRFKTMNKSEKSGKILAISVSTKKGIPKTNVNTAHLIVAHGIEGDAHAGEWHRQISLLSIDSIEKMRQAGLPELNPGDFAENLTTDLSAINQIPLGTKLKIGEDTIIEITQIGKECHSRCAIFDKVGDCVMPREGIFAKVISGGSIQINDTIEIL